MNNAQSANIIKNLCRIRGYPVSKMLTDCCIRKSLMYDMEKRDWTPSATVFEQIADYLDCSVDYLLGRTDVVEVARSEEYITIPVAARGPLSENAVLAKEEKAAADAKHPELAPKNKK